MAARCINIEQNKIRNKIQFLMLYDSKFKRVVLSDNEQGQYEPSLNQFDFEGKTYFLKPISPNYKVSKGGNSSVFILNDPSGEIEDRAIKIANLYKINRFSPEAVKRRYGRFMNEIDALKKVRDFDISTNVVNIEFDGFIEIDGKEFPFYVMEKADSDLKEFLLTNFEEIDFQERIKLCRDIFKGIKALNDLDFYHRDIKPDNILLFYVGDANGEGQKFIWKVGDLGLVAHRDKDYDDIGEKIGPIGWLSPEAMNKYLTEEYALGLDCAINEFSDMFQLGKLFWFIFEYNVPIGQITENDFKFVIPHKKFVFDLIFNMLQYSKERRHKKEKIQENIELLSMEFGV